MPCKIVQTDSYLRIAAKFFRKHPDLIQKYAKTVTLLETNPFHPSLRLHKLSGKQKNSYSVSIDLSYRVVLDLIVENSQIVLIDIGSHDEVYR